MRGLRQGGHKEYLSILSFVGLNEAVQFMTGAAIQEDSDSLNFADKTISYLTDQIDEYKKKTGIRINLGLPSNFEAAARLAQLDIERYGLGTVLTQGGRDNPYYTNLNVVPHHIEMPLEDYLEAESHFHKLISGSHLAKVSLDHEVSPEDLMAITKKIISEYKIGLYTYDRALTYCNSCRKIWHGEKMKCPTCGSVNALTRFKRESARYIARRT